MNNNLQWTLEEISDGTATNTHGYLAACPACGGDVFYIFYPATHVQQHMHIQCAGCEQTYCQLGICELTKAPEVNHD